MNPFYSQFNMPGMNFSFSNYEMTNGSLQSSMNCLMNQAWADMSARRGLYFYPQYSFNNFSEYQSIFSNNYLTDINYTLGQYHFNSLAQGGCGLYGWNATPTFGNGQCGGWTPWGWQTPSSSSSSSNGSNNDEFKVEYDALKKLLETYRDKTNCGSKTKSAIRTALNKSGSYEEKLEALKDVYKKLNKENLRKTIALLPEYKTALENAGYKFGGSNSFGSSDVKITDIYNAINSLENTDDEQLDTENNSFGDIEALAEMSDGKANNILAIISKWNDTYRENSGKGSIIDFVISKKGSKNAENIYTHYVTPLVTALTNKAEQVKADGNFDEKTNNELDTIIDNLNEALRDKSDYAVKTNFKKLYVMLREMEAQRINQAIKEEYKFLNDIADDDTDFINNKTIIAETKKDLEDEGLANISSIVAASIVIDSSDELADDEGIEDEEPKTAEQEMSDLITDGALKRVKRTEAGETIYEETTVADGATPKQYIVKDDKIYEYANGQAGTEEVFPENIKSAYDEVVQTKAEAEAEKAKQDAENKTAQQEQTLSSAAYEHGELVADYLDDCCTNGSQEKEIAFRIEKINNGDARYTYNFLKAIYENYDDNEGFFEKLEDDCSDSNVSVELRITFLEKILEAAGREEFGSMDYDTCSSYKKLKDMLDKFKTYGENNFNATESRRSWFSWTNYSEAFDTLIEGIYNDMDKNKKAYDDAKTKELDTQA